MKPENNHNTDFDPNTGLKLRHLMRVEQTEKNMPLPKKNKDQDPKQFISNCMGTPSMKKEYPDQKQRVAICINQSKADIMSQTDLHMQYAEASWDEEWNEFTYEVSIAGGVFHEDDRDKSLMGPAGGSKEGGGDKKSSKVKLNKPFRTPDGPKKFSVHVKNDSGNIVKVNFGDPNMEIKRDDPERRKSYRARHNCDNPGPKWKANYWSCKMWSKMNVSDLT